MNGGRGSTPDEFNYVYYNTILVYLLFIYIYIL